MASNYTEYHLQLINMRTGLPVDDDSGVYNVLTADSPAEATIYSDDLGTSASNPATMTDGKLHFWTASTVTSVDVSVQTNNGEAYFIQGLTPSQHRRGVDPECDDYTLIIPYTYDGCSETVVDTGFDILQSMQIRDVFLHVTTAASASGALTLDVGTSTDTDGFIDGQITDVTGFYPVIETLTAGTIGVLLATATSSAIRNLHTRANSTSGTTIMYENITSCATAGAGYIYVRYHRVRTSGN